MKFRISKLSKLQELKEKLHKKYLHKATLYYPEDIICFWCGGKNNFVDDCGFWYIYGDKNDIKINGVCCEKCYNGKPGKIHIARFGIGER